MTKTRMLLLAGSLLLAGCSQPSGTLAPAQAAQRIELFKAHGAMREGVDELFRASSWQSVFEGMGIRPRGHSPRVENLDYAQIEQSLKNAKAAIAGMVEHLPTHEQFLRTA